MKYTNEKTVMRIPINLKKKKKNKRINYKKLCLDTT